MTSNKEDFLAQQELIKKYHIGNVQYVVVYTLEC